MSRRAATPPAPAWSGHLAKTPDGIRGRLQDATGWTLALCGIPAATGLPAVPVVPATLHLRGDVIEVGRDEGPERSILAELPWLHGRLEHHDGDWRGELAVRGLVVALTGATAGPGQIALQGVG